MTLKEFFQRRDVLLGLALSAVAIGFHLLFFTHAGGLWRDEVNSVNMATLPSIRDIWVNNQFDSFPMLWFVILRYWHAIGIGGSDIGWRILGLIIGMLILLAAWFNARLLNYRSPALVVALLAMNPEIIRWGDSMRAYGLGIVLLLLLFSAVWKVVERPTPWRVIFAIVVGVLSVQCLYYNSVILLCIAVAGAIVCAASARWRDAIIVLLIGLPAALSMIPYARTIRQVNEWSGLVRINFTFGRFWEMLSGVLSATHPLMVYFWLLVLVLALVAGIRSRMRSRPRWMTPAQRDLVLYGFLTLCLAIPAYIVFLFRLSYETEPWYYLALVTVVACSCEAILVQFVRRYETRLIATVALIAVAAAGVYGSGALRARQTSVDLQAQTLSIEADKNDLILVYPWYVGLTFNRYYTGPAQWMTVPEVKFLTYHRFDMTRKLMMDPDNALNSVMAAMRRTLSSGHKIWVVGGFPILHGNEVPPRLPPAPHPKYQWFEGVYNRAWAMQAGYFLQTHANDMRVIPLGEPVQRYEDMALEQVSGWSGDPR